MHGKPIIHWSSRILALCFVLFLSLFALDVFGAYSGWGIIVPLFIHLIPSFLLAAAIAVAWRYEWVGAAVFFGFAIWYVAEAGLDRPWGWYAVIALPAIVVGILFLTEWVQE